MAQAELLKFELDDLDETAGRASELERAASVISLAVASHCRAYQIGKVARKPKGKRKGRLHKCLNRGSTLMELSEDMELPEGERPIRPEGFNGRRYREHLSSRAALRWEVLNGSELLRPSTGLAQSALKARWANVELIPQAPSSGWGPRGDNGPKGAVCDCPNPSCCDPSGRS